MTVPVNAFTVDVEDYFQVSAFADNVRKDDWGSYESRVSKNTGRILDMLDEHKISGTFFVLGWVAERYPELVREIRSRGHEIGCHGFSHDLVYNQTPEVFRDETIRAKSILEDAIGEPVLGYRAASYSVTRRSLWALDILIDAGFTYDSSIFPISHDRYGIPNAPRFPFRLEVNGRTIREFPLTTARYGNLRVPVAGGGYFRLLPYFYTLRGLTRVNRKEGAPAVFYLHPWEIDADQPRMNGSLLSRFRHYTNLDACEKRLDRLLSAFRWGPMGAVLDDMHLDPIALSTFA